MVGVLLLAAAPDLLRGLAPLGRSCIIVAWHSRLLPLTEVQFYPIQELESNVFSG